MTSLASKVLVSDQSVKAYLLDNGGKVRYTNMVNYFGIPTTEIQQKAGQNVNDVIQRIGVMDTEKEGKYVALPNLDNRSQTPLVSNTRGTLSDCVLTKMRAYSNDVNDTNSPELKERRITSNGRPKCLQYANRNTVMDKVPPRSVPVQRSSRILTTEFPDINSIKAELASKRHCFSDNSSISIDSIPEDVDDYVFEDTAESKSLQKQLLVAAVYGDSKTVTSLIDSHPELVNKRDFITGHTVLHWGAKLGRVDIVRMIVTKGIDVNIKTRGGQTALHLGAIHGHNDVIRMLVDDFGANVDIRNYLGKKPKDVIKNTLAADVQRRLGRSLILTRDLSRSPIVKQLDIIRRHDLRKSKK